MEVLGGGSLQISNLTEEDAGTYTCMADNANATIEAQAQLTLQGKFNNLHLLSFVHSDMQCVEVEDPVPHDLNQNFVVQSQTKSEYTHCSIFFLSKLGIK